MAMDLTWLLSAKDSASPVFDQVQAAGKKTANEIGSAFDGLRGKFDLITGAVGGLVAIAGGMAFKSIVSETVNWDLSAGKLATTLGMTTEAASVLMVAAHSVGVEQDVVEKAGLKLAKTLGSNEEVFQKLGVATRDSAGHLRSTAELMPEVNQKLSEMKAGTDRNVIAMEIYGRSWGEIKGMLKINSEAMKEADETAHRLHLIVGDDGVAQAKKYKKEMAELELVGKSLKIQLGNVLLPVLVQLGAWFGEAGPALVWVFDKTLKLVMKTFETVGDYIGLLAYRAYSLGAILKDVFTGNFAEAKQDWANMVAAGEDFQKKATKIWTDWSDKSVTSKAKGGKQLDGPDTGADAAAMKDKTAQEIKLWKDRAKEIIEVEKERWKILIEGEKEYGKQILEQINLKKKEIDDLRKELKSFQDDIAKSDKALADKMKPQIDARLDAYDRYIAVVKNLRAEEAKANEISDESKRNKALAGIYDQWSQITDEVKVGNDVIITQNEILDKSRAEMARIKEAVAGNLTARISAAEQEKLILELAHQASMDRLAAEENKVKDLDLMIKNLARDHEINLNVKINGINDLRAISALTQNPGAQGLPTMGAMGAADYYQQGGNMYWGNGDYAGPALATGTNYVPADGPAYLHKGEAVVPAKYNPSAGGSATTAKAADTYHFNGDIILPNVTDQSTARDLFSEFQKLARQRTA